MKLTFEPQDIYRESAALQKRELASHEGFLRKNDGSWCIADENGNLFATLPFHGKAKRGETWNAPDPEGQALAAELVRRWNAHEELVAILEAILEDRRFDVHIGGNPLGVAALFVRMRSALAEARK